MPALAKRSRHDDRHFAHAAREHVRRPRSSRRACAPTAAWRAARAECRTSELTLAEFKTLRGKVDAFDPAAQTVEQFVAPMRAPRPDLGARVERGTLLTHAESIELFKRLGVRMTPELKEPSVRLPFNGITREPARAEAHRRVLGGRRRAE